MKPKTVNLDRAVGSFLEMREISWEMGIASLCRDGMSREEAIRALSELWCRASVARERRWRPRRRKADGARP